MGNNQLCGADICCQEQAERHSITLDLKQKELPARDPPEQTKDLHIEVVNIGPDGKAREDNIEQPIQTIVNQEGNQSKTDKLSNQPCELFLDINQEWMQDLKNQESKPINILKVYQEIKQSCLIKDKSAMSRLRRVGLENRKIQLLFGEPIPMTGQYFYEIELLSYFPKNKCEFTVGVVDYFEAKDQLHSRDSFFEQSYTYSERNLDISQAEASKPYLINKQMRVEISREKPDPYMYFSINGVLMAKEELKESLLDESVVLVPYCQTQHEGVQFQWKKAPTSYKLRVFPLSVISEEKSTANENNMEAA